MTNDAATIIRELEVVHPAAKLLVMASQQQEAEVDQINYSLTASTQDFDLPVLFFRSFKPTYTKCALFSSFPYFDLPFLFFLL